MTRFFLKNILVCTLFFLTSHLHSQGVEIAGFGGVGLMNSVTSSLTRSNLENPAVKARSQAQTTAQYGLRVTLRKTYFLGIANGIQTFHTQYAYQTFKSDHSLFYQDNNSITTEVFYLDLSAGIRITPRLQVAVHFTHQWRSKKRFEYQAYLDDYLTDDEFSVIVAETRNPHNSGSTHKTLGISADYNVYKGLYIYAGINQRIMQQKHLFFKENDGRYFDHIVSIQDDQGYMKPWKEERTEIVNYSMFYQFGLKYFLSFRTKKKKPESYIRFQ